ncbi:CBS domain-containing protein [Streptomyces cavernicola]|uniref:CBS domain-containing protein n=1 Tax=Streptomyces cavernicola TaxID=3043613 RepID=A0ABT6SF95_9ACTN|nr:CBS domain-containing protein [Streptomyces sp. B-S-A6]MDI3406872.1 CBS domain-containing protein [Streptomyces sp. B-S-A6]
MRHRRISELMTREVVSVRGDTPFKEVVRALRQHRITAAPVVDGENRVLGVVSEGDLLRKTTDRSAAPADLPAVPGVEAWERAKAAGTRAEELMSAPAVCARPDWTVAEAARLMEVQDVKRLPVVDEGDRLVGIVSRRDLLGIFLREDEDISREITEDVLDATLGLDPRALSVAVHDGRVEVGGRAPYRIIPAIERMCSTVDGVVSASYRWLTASPD